MRIRSASWTSLQNDFMQDGYFGLQSSLYAKASQIDRPLSRSYFSKSSLAVYFRASILPVTIQYVGYVYLAETDKLPRRDFHPLAQIFCWLRPHRTVLALLTHTAPHANIHKMLYATVSFPSYSRYWARVMFHCCNRSHVISFPPATLPAFLGTIRLSDSLKSLFCLSPVLGWPAYSHFMKEA